ncbi:MAG: o-succinylbenzoate synthase [Chthoniobacterales bacterium]
MRIDFVTLRPLRVPLKTPFESSLRRTTHRETTLVTVGSGEAVGYAEDVAGFGPFYSEETPGSVKSMLEEYLIPMLLGREISHPNEVADIFAGIRRNTMAISSLECAVWDLWCRQKGISLSAALGGTRKEIAVGVSIGLEASIERILERVAGFVKEGYRRIKVKIKPGFDIELLREIRNTFGSDLPLMVDANSAYTLKDISLLKKLDQFGLMMIEQPLGHDDIVDHAVLQKEMATPICLDESIHSVEDARKAISLGSCRIINIKIGRVGGLRRAKELHDLCQDHNIPVWCGGMLELGVGRAQNLALASLPNFSIAGDTSAWHRSFAEDIVTPAIDFSRPGFLAVRTTPGIGCDLLSEAVEKFTSGETQAFFAKDLL